jgi:uncharacterized SAM-binding protein YcdF (DUF218 family)
MYFILSKLLLYLLFPLSWIFILLVIAIASNDKKRKQRFLIAAVILLFIFSNAFLFNRFAKLWDVSPYELKSADTYKCAIILGGFSGGGYNEKGHFNASSDRFIQGIKLLSNHSVSHLLITGGNGSLNPAGFREGPWVKTQLEELKFPDSALLIEGNSKNTIENARFSNILLKQSHLPGPYLLVTSAFHMRRALMIFKKEGMNVIPYSCNFIRSDKIGFDDFFIPDAEKLAAWNLYIKEVVGYAINYFNG